MPEPGALRRDATLVYGVATRPFAVLNWERSMPNEVTEQRREPNLSWSCASGRILGPRSALSRRSVSNPEHHETMVEC